jgi:hypothetical protein
MQHDYWMSAFGGLFSVALNRTPPYAGKSEHF